MRRYYRILTVCLVLMRALYLSKGEVKMARSPLSTRSYYIVVVLMITAFVLKGQNASTLTYQQETDVQFTFNPVINIGLCGDLVIPELNPGTSSDSNIITVTTGTNDIHGYSLFANVGNNQKNYTDLRMENNSTDKFTNLSTVRTALTDFTDNEWGYSYSSDNINWISGDVDSSTMGYAGLPLHNATNSAGGVKILDTNTPTDASLKFKIGAKASPDQPSGTYTNIVNFFGVAKVLATDYALNYIDTSGTATGMPGNQTGITNNAVVTISNSTPTKAGHVFKGWCDASTNDDTCSGNVYMPGSLYIINNPGQTTTINLYVMWAVHIAPLAPTDCPDRSICYAPNADDIEGSMSSIGALPAAATGGIQKANTNREYTLISANYKRAGYGLAGWSNSYNATPGIDTIYGPNETISTNPTNGGVDVSVNGLILYPVWVASTGNIQNWTGCSAMAIGDITALTDDRDGNVYTVSKLADGNCWMTENLRLDAEHSGDGSLAEGYGTGFIGLDLSEDNFNNTTNATPTGMYSNINVTGNYNDHRIPRYNNNNTNIGGKNSAGTDLTPSHNLTGNYSQWYSYGNYYTWAASMANITALNSLTVSESAGTSLCPAGWELPLSGRSNNSNSGSFYNLNFKINNDTNEGNIAASRNIRKFPNNFLLSGSWGFSNASRRHFSGSYWSRSASNAYLTNYLNFSVSAVGPSETARKFFGQSIRCVRDS